MLIDVSIKFHAQLAESSEKKGDLNLHSNAKQIAEKHSAVGLSRLNHGGIFQASKRN